MSRDYLVDKLYTVGSRLNGFSIDYRRAGTTWPGPWRVRIVATKNERDEYRIVRYGQSLVEAVNEALIAVEDATAAVVG